MAKRFSADTRARLDRLAGELDEIIEGATWSVIAHGFDGSIDNPAKADELVHDMRRLYDMAVQQRDADPRDYAGLAKTLPALGECIRRLTIAVHG